MRSLPSPRETLFSARLTPESRFHSPRRSGPDLTSELGLGSTQQTGVHCLASVSPIVDTREPTDEAVNSMRPETRDQRPETRMDKSHDEIPRVIQAITVYRLAALSFVVVLSPVCAACPGCLIWRWSWTPPIVTWDSCETAGAPQRRDVGDDPTATTLAGRGQAWSCPCAGAKPRPSS